MSIIELSGNVDENHELHLTVPRSFPAGPVKVMVYVAGEDPADWGRAVLARWAMETNDPCEDIYTLDDGEPVESENTVGDGK